MFYADRYDFAYNEWSKANVDKFNIQNCNLGACEFLRQVLTKDYPAIEIPFISISAAGVEFSARLNRFNADMHIVLLDDGIGKVYTRMIHTADGNYTFESDVGKLNMANTKMYAPQGNWTLEIQANGDYYFTCDQYQSTFRIASATNRFYIAVTRGPTAGHGDNSNNSYGVFRGEMSLHFDDLTIQFYPCQSNWSSNLDWAYFLSAERDLTVCQIMNSNGFQQMAARAIDNNFGTYGGSTLNSGCYPYTANQGAHGSMMLIGMPFLGLQSNRIFQPCGIDDPLTKIPFRQFANIVGSKIFWKRSFFAVGTGYDGAAGISFIFKLDHKEFLDEINGNSI